jgi:hypothetical protein
MKCDVCGSENLEGAAYCEDCGGKLVVAAVAPSAAAVAPAPVAPPPAAPPAAAPAAVSAPSAGGAVHVQCSSCGASNLASESYCVDCGANLRQGAVAPAPAPIEAAVSAAPAAPTQVAARLVLVSNGQQFMLSQDLTTMGRRSLADHIEPDIDLTDHDPDSYVSRRHAKITRTDSGYLFEDVGSSNGSTINGGGRLAAGVQHLLKAGDRVTLGRTEFEFKV